MTFKPFNDIDEHEVRNLFALDTGAGTKGQLVRIAGNGFVNGPSFGVFQNMSPSVPNVLFPRFSVQAKVTLSQPGDANKPFGIMLYDTKEQGFDRPLIFDPIRLAEAQAVPSGYAVPILRKGMITVGPWPTGVSVGPGSGAVAGNSGEWSVIQLSGSSQADRSRCFADFLGAPDKDGYAVVDVNCFI